MLPGSQHGGLVAHEVSADHGAFHDTLPDSATRRAVAVPGRAGDAIFFGSLLHHASGANTSDRPRHSFTTVYTNPLVDVHREVYGWFFPIDRIKALGGPGPFGFCGEHYQRRSLWRLAADHVADPTWTWLEISDRSLDDGSCAWLSARKPPGCTYHRFEEYPLVTSNRDAVRVRAGALSEILDLKFYNYFGWEDHEFKAFTEFALAERVQFEYLGRTPTCQVSLRVLARGFGTSATVRACDWAPTRPGIGIRAGRSSAA